MVRIKYDTVDDHDCKLGFVTNWFKVESYTEKNKNIETWGHSTQSKGTPEVDDEHSQAINRGVS